MKYHNNVTEGTYYSQGTTKENKEKATAFAQVEQHANANCDRICCDGREQRLADRCRKTEPRLCSCLHKFTQHDRRLAGHCEMNRPTLVHGEDLYPNASSARKLDSSTGQNSGGLVVTQEMLRILSQPGHLSIAQGGQKLRELYVERESPSSSRVLIKQTTWFAESFGFDATKLSDFGLCCYVGEFTQVQKVWSIKISSLHRSKDAEGFSK